MYYFNLVMKQIVVIRDFLIMSCYAVKQCKQTR